MLFTIKKPTVLLSSALVIVAVFPFLCQSEECGDRPYRTLIASRNASDYPFYEAGLQIFTNLQIPCDGVLTEWTFYPVLQYVIQLHLIVFRQRAAKVFQQVGESYVDVWKLPNVPRLPGGWVSYQVDPPIPVMQGDVIGMYYDNFATISPMLPIASKKLLGIERDLAHPTYIMLLDANQVHNLNYYIDVTTAAIEYRIPALGAIVKNPNQNLYPTQPPPPIIPTEPPIILPPTTEWIPPTTEEWTEPPTTPRRTRSTTRQPRTRPTTTPYLETTQPPYTDYVDQETPVWVPPTRQPPRTNPLITTPRGPRIDGRCYAAPTSALFCTQRQVRAFFDFASGICREYFGCPAGGDLGNNFDSSSECRSVCIGQQQATEDVCRRTPTALEVCYEKSTRFFYNPYKQGCMSFYGCSLGGLKGNNFDTLEQCNLCKGQAVLTPISGAGSPPSSAYAAPVHVAQPASGTNVYSAQQPPSQIVFSPVGQQPGFPAGLQPYVES